MDAIRTLYWLLVLTTVPGAFVVGCVYALRSTARKPTTLPAARVVRNGAVARARELGDWTLDACTNLTRFVLAGVAGLCAVFLDYLVVTAVVAVLTIFVS